jgi:hypothetical protein
MAVNKTLYVLVNMIELKFQNEYYVFENGPLNGKSEMSLHVSGSRKSKIADMKPEAHATSLADMIKSKFQM